MNFDPIATSDTSTNHEVEDPRALLDTLPASKRLVEISPGLAEHAGLIPHQFVPSACAAAIFNVHHKVKSTGFQPVSFS